MFVSGGGLEVGFSDGETSRSNPRPSGPWMESSFNGIYNLITLGCQCVCNLGLYYYYYLMVRLQALFKHSLFTGPVTGKFGPTQYVTLCLLKSRLISPRWSMSSLLSPKTHL